MTEVIYFERPELPGKRFFECPEGYGCLNTGFCAESHINSNTKQWVENRKRQECRHCQVGALHAGKSLTPAPSRLFGKQICSRCERSASRLVGPGRVCVSCFNRQRELEKGGGMNAKGHPVRKIRNYRNIQMVVINDGHAQTVEARGVMTMSEAVLSRLINEQGQQMFAWAGGVVREKKIEIKPREIRPHHSVFIENYYECA